MYVLFLHPTIVFFSHGQKVPYNYLTSFAVFSLLQECQNVYHNGSKAAQLHVIAFVHLYSTMNFRSEKSILMGVKQVFLDNQSDYILRELLKSVKRIFLQLFLNHFTFGRIPFPD